MICRLKVVSTMNENVNFQESEGYVRKGVFEIIIFYIVLGNSMLMKNSYCIMPFETAFIDSNGWLVCCRCSEPFESA